MRKPQRSRAAKGPELVPNGDAHAGPRASELRPPADIDVHSFTIGADEFVVLSFSIAAAGLRAELLEVLTPTERAIATLAAEGRSTSEIARARGTSPHTVSNQLRAIYRKLGVASRRELGARIRSPQVAP